MNLEGFLTPPTVLGAILYGLLQYGAALLGALLTYFFATSKGLEGTTPRLRQLFPGRTDTFYIRFDFLIVIVVGPVVGLICFQPITTIFQALAAGCGWVGAVQVLVQQKPPQNVALGPSTVDAETNR